MDYQVNYINPELKLSCYEGKLFKTEAAFQDHLLVWLISGETKIIQADESFVFGAGSTFLIPRNQLATIINYPKDELPHKAVAMHLSTKRLKEFFDNQSVKSEIETEKIIHFHPHPLLESCLNSLIPYFEIQNDFPENIASLKINEAINILRTIDPKIDAVLNNFEEPGKIDLKTFMEKNFMFNMSLEKFGYLTGRSLTTFKRDFHEAFHMTPQRWLTKKRLEMAHYELTEKNKKPVDFYHEIGFENLSHFSFAFKKQYGLSPRELIGQNSYFEK
ncbi:AraC family transcriptional regulator [Chryseobacterium formosense]|uniref:AraC family transcriptional regulator n=1 Tax=Chryseobacterium formosense TaxID=236814 RepID=A0A085Z856_9FLAO|nr:helix-turn-helix domain-containing protein [Chryseobacterium formosense]KFF00620.1 AraC family transcriptional regulator [Chryseobacterium formosense]SFT35773.1 AraC-type DNA-binding protein [Chryseobacterium formosense]